MVQISRNLDQKDYHGLQSPAFDYLKRRDEDELFRAIYFLLSYLQKFLYYPWKSTSLPNLLLLLIVLQDSADEGINLHISHAFFKSKNDAEVAQLVEQLIRNQ
jgi:hypothetical protein